MRYVRVVATEEGGSRFIDVDVEQTFEVETTDGERRVFRPGNVALVEDTFGRGHVTRLLSGPATFAGDNLGE